ncbi:MAG: oligosaccharide flippase family protein [Candidatus Melainabacteria bacterium]|nr:oligosaccharide flippase family protein [Candidatus Melainabacteria bacterium]
MKSNNYPPLSISSKFITAISWTTLASLIARSFGLITSVFIARSLGSNLLGLYTIILSTLGLFSTFLSFGLGLTGSKLVAQYYINDPKKTGKVITLLLLALIISILFGAVIYWLLVPFVSNRVYRIPELLSILKLSLPWLVLMCVNQFLEPVLAGLQGFKPLMLTSSVYSILNLPLILVGLFLGGANILKALIIVGSIGAAIQLLLLLWAVYLESKKFGIELSFKELSPLIRPVFFDFSLPAFIGKIMEQPLSWLSIFLLVKFTGNPSYVGGLTIITTIRTWILYFPNLLASTLIPILTDIYHTRESGDFNRTLILNQRFLWFVTFPFVVLVLAVIRPTIAIFFGNSYEVFWFSGAVFLFWTILLPINEVNDKAMVAMNKMWLSLSFRIIYLILLVIGLLLLIPKFNLNGYVIAYGLSYFIYVAVQTMWLKKITQEHISSFFPLTVFSCFTLTISFFVAYFCSINKAIVSGSIIFFIVLVIEWVYLIKAEEKTLLASILKRYLKR